MKYFTHYLAVFLFSLTVSLSGQDVQIFMDHPEIVNAGDDFEVSLIINKGPLKDYSRFSQDLPPGLTATNVSSPNADFSFDEQRIRIIWLKLPEEKEIRVKYRISVDARLKGTFRLEGVFAYVVDDERKFLNLDGQQPISIVPNSSINQAMIVDIEDFEGGTTTETSPISTRDEDMFAMAVRQKPELQNTGAYMVHLLIKNPSGSKYAKVEETIPTGYMFEEVNSSGGIVSHAASTVKIIWMAMPSQSEFEVKYRLVPIQDEPQGNMEIEGLLTYTAGSENRVVEIVEVDASLDNLSTAQRRELLATGNIPQAAQVTQTTSETGVESRPPARSTDTGGASPNFIANTKVLDRGTGTYFRVQLAANVTPFDATSFYRQAGISREVLVEEHNGYYKYTVGPFQTYEQALIYVEEANRLEEVKGAFVVGYRNGSRVSAGSIR